MPCEDGFGVGVASITVAARHRRREDRDQQEDEGFGAHIGLHRGELGRRHLEAGAGAGLPVPGDEADGGHDRQQANDAERRHLRPEYPL